MKPAARFGAVLVAAALAAPSFPARAQQPATDGWRPFQATWTLSGTRHLLPTGGARPAAIVQVAGALAVTGGEGLGRGFLGEMIGFDDGGEFLLGRAVLTDEKGDRIYCALKAEPVGTGRKATGMITGGTGRYAGLEGTFGFSWQYVVDAGADEIGGRIVNIEGRTRVAPPSGRELPR